MRQHKGSIQGFTLIEIMMVLLLMGLMVSYVLFNAFSVSQADKLKEQVQRLQVIVDMASDYAVLNQLQMGIRFEQADNLYYFVYLDDEDEWQKIDSDPIYAEQELPEDFELALELDSLPWVVEEQLFDRELFDETLSVSEDGVQIGDEEEEKLPPPQVLILASGEITPFSLLMQYEPRFGEDEPVYFYLNNKDVPPLEVDGPLDEPYDS